MVTRKSTRWEHNGEWSYGSWTRVKAQDMKNLATIKRWQMHGRLTKLRVCNLDNYSLSCFLKWKDWAEIKEKSSTSEWL